jgi:Short C-terminal domain/Phospholipase_D-nuclease N-terminal
MPLLDLFWAMLWFFLFFAWIWLLITVIADIFRSRDMSGWAKALWVLFIIVVPWLGVLIYLIARGQEMGERHMQDAIDREKAARSYIQEAAGSTTSSADELAKLAELRNSGVITNEEFDAQKAKILAQG